MAPSRRGRPLPRGLLQGSDPEGLLLLRFRPVRTHQAGAGDQGYAPSLRRPAPGSPA